MYQSFVSKISCTPTAMKKYDKAFNTDTFHLDWEKIYVLPSNVTLHTRLREFQYKTLNRILYTNEILFKIKKSWFPVVLFLWYGVRDLRTFFFYCSKVRAFWDEVTVMLNSQGITFRPLDIKDIVFGFVDSNCMLY